MTNPKIITLPETHLLGHSIQTTLTKNESKQLWTTFRQDLSKTAYSAAHTFYNVHQYKNLDFFKQYSPNTEFIKWACTKLNPDLACPDGFKSLQIETGLYAIFEHHGSVLDFNRTMTFILQEWLPNSEYVLDHRAHFEVLDHRYLGPMNPDSVEDVYIPIKLK